jgi:hypothetical protein
MKMYEPIKILSDGDKIVVIADGKSYVLNGAVVSNFSYKIDRPMMDVSRFGDDPQQFVSGLAETSLDISLRGGMMSMAEDKNVFDMKKMEKYTKQINQEVQEIALRRSLEF